MNKIFKAVIMLSIIFVSMINIFVYANESVDAKLIFDSSEKVVLVVGKLSSGADRDLSIVVKDSKNEIKFLDYTTTKTGGSFSFAIGYDRLSDDTYTFEIKNDEDISYSSTFSIPFNVSPIKISALVNQYDMLMDANNRVDINFNTITVQLNNAETFLGLLENDKYEIIGIPDTIKVKAIARNEKIIDFVFSGNLPDVHSSVNNIKIKLKSKIIYAGQANTSVIIDNISIKSAEESAKVLFVQGQNSYNFYMRNNTQIDFEKSFFDLDIKYRNLSKNGMLIKGTDFDYSRNLEGMNISVVANSQSNKLRVSLTGNSNSNINSNITINDFVIKPNIVNGVTSNSYPINITIVANSSSDPTSIYPTGGSNTGNNTTYPTIISDKVDTEIEPYIPLGAGVDVKFTDINNHWAKNYIIKLFYLKIVKGVTEDKFEPNASVTRAEFIAMVVRALKLENKVKETSSSFKDVNAGDWYSKYIEVALSNNIISKTEQFRPNEFINREEMAKIIATAVLTTKEKPKYIASPAYLTDYNTISDWARKYVDLAYTFGLIKGNSNNLFNPKSNATRAETATVINKLIN